jgi:hypothetical protein
MCVGPFLLSPWVLGISGFQNHFASFFSAANTYKRVAYRPGRAIGGDFAANFRGRCD